MLNQVIGLDHVVVVAHDLDAAAAGWRDLGFTVSPRGTHSAHMGTGNYHTATARIYTDYSLLSANESLAEDVHHVFLQLTSLTRTPPLQRLYQAPFNLHERMLHHIETEIRNVEAGGAGHIIAKLNAQIVQPDNGILNHIVEESGAERWRIQIDGRQKSGHGQRMHDIRLAALAPLRDVGLFGHSIGALHQLKSRLVNTRRNEGCLLYTSPSPRDGLLSRMPSSA